MSCTKLEKKLHLLRRNGSDGIEPIDCCVRTGWRLAGWGMIVAVRQENRILCRDTLKFARGGPEITRDTGAHVTWHCHPGIIRVTSHRMKDLERVRISCMSNRLQRDYLKKWQCQEPRGTELAWLRRGWINNILQDYESFDTRTMGQCVRKQGRPRKMTRRMITSSEMESETRRPDDWGNARNWHMRWRWLDKR